MSAKIKNKISIFGGKIVIVTGGIGSGKSCIMKYLSYFGFVTFNTDEAVHKLMLPSGAAYGQISLSFPEALVDGYIDRGKLANIVFENEEALLTLEGIIYPSLRQYRQEWIRFVQAKSRRSIAIEIPLFFEKPDLFTTIQYDFVIAAVCEVDLQRHRALSRKGGDLTRINKIISMQVENDHRLKAADFIVDTNKSRLSTALQLLKLLKW